MLKTSTLKTLDLICPNWLDFLNSFESLDKETVRDFVRRCLDQSATPVFMVVLYDNDNVRHSIDDMLRFMLKWTGVLAPKHYSLVSKSENAVVQVLEGVPDTAEKSQRLKKGLAKTRTRVIAFAKNIAEIDLPTYTLADLRGKSQIEVEIDDFSDQLDGIAQWANARPLPRPIKQN